MALIIDDAAQVDRCINDRCTRRVRAIIEHQPITGQIKPCRACDFNRLIGVCTTIIIVDFVDEDVGRANRGGIIIGDRAVCDAITNGRAASWVHEEHCEIFIGLYDCIASNVENNRLAGFAISEVYST